MSIFNIITLFGGLAMFLFGMRVMGDGLKESASGTSLLQFFKPSTLAPLALIERILTYAGGTFKRCDAASAQRIEPLEVVDDMVNAED